MCVKAVEVALTQPQHMMIYGVGEIFFKLFEHSLPRAGFATEA